MKYKFSPRFESHASEKTIYVAYSGVTLPRKGIVLY